MASPLLNAQAAHVARVKATRMRVAVVNGWWAVAAKAPGGRWAIVPTPPLQASPSISDVLELGKVRAWLRQEVLGGVPVDLEPDTRRPGTWDVYVDEWWARNQRRGRSVPHA